MSRFELGGFVPSLLRRPVLLWEAVRFLLSIRSRSSLVPSAAYLHWRIHTVNGDVMSPVPSSDVLAFLSWRRAMRRLA